MPKIMQFSPRGKAGRPDEIELRIDHLEAIKISDYQGYDQSEGAKAMRISRPSFGRILREARKIIADAITNGKVIRIRIGNAQVGVYHKNLPLKQKICESFNMDATNRPRKQEELLRTRIVKYHYHSSKKSKRDVISSADSISAAPAINSKE